MAKSIKMSDYPPIDNVVRAVTYLAGWRVKKISENTCKVTFAAHSDFKIATFISKQVLPKSGNLALNLKHYLT